jgi:streptomycin 6-kinase
VTSPPKSARVAPEAARAGPETVRPSLEAVRASPATGRAGAAVKRDVPEPVRAKAVAAGAAGWLAELPGIVASLERDWGITVGRSYGDATEALVAEATRADGTPAVLKVLVPRAGNQARSEITFLELAGGRGCVSLLRADLGRSALLLERLGPSMSDLRLPLAQRHEALCAAAAKIWRTSAGAGRRPAGSGSSGVAAISGTRPASTPGAGLRAEAAGTALSTGVAGTALPTGAAAGRRLAEVIVRLWEELGRPCSERAVAYALDCAERRVAAYDEERAVLVHGDVHQWNALRSADGFKLVDPDGYLAEPEYDLGVLMREDPEELLAGDPRDRSRWLARRCGLDETAIWEWGVVSRVETGLVGTQVGLQPVAGQMLMVADRVAA